MDNDNAEREKKNGGLCNVDDDAHAVIQLPFSKKNQECPLLFHLSFFFSTQSELQFHTISLDFILYDWTCICDTDEAYIHWCVWLASVMVFDKCKKKNTECIGLIAMVVFHNSRSRPFQNWKKEKSHNKRVRKSLHLCKWIP